MTDGASISFIMENPITKTESTFQYVVKHPVKGVLFLILLIFCVFVYYCISAWATRIVSPLPSLSKFSTTTNVYLRDYPADKNIINLDNVGMLRSWGGSFGNSEPANQIVLALNTPVSVLGEFNAPRSNGAAYFYQENPDKDNLFTFNFTTRKSNKIKVEGRTFLVTLINIKNLSKNEFDINYEYQFMASEI